MKIALVTLVKNELFYIKEWVLYHLAMGFDSIYIIEDFGSESHSFVLLNNVHVIKLETIINQKEFTRHNIQRDVANYYINILKSKYDWMAYIDADEYIMTYLDLHQILEQYNDTDGVYMLWHNYNANGHFNRPNGPILLNYTLTCKISNKDNVHWQRKSICNLHRKARWINPHSLTSSVYLIDIWVNHYICKSFLDYCFKIYSRGDVYHRVYRNFDEFIELNPEFKYSDLENYVLNTYKTLDEYVQIGENPIEGITPKKSIGKLISVFPEEISISGNAQSFYITIYATDDCGILKIEDATGLYSIEHRGLSLKINAKAFYGGPGVKHRLKIYGQNGGYDTFYINRYGYNRNARIISNNNKN